MADRSLYCKNTILGFLRKKEPLFGGWKVVSFLGAGAFGCVFKLEREDLGAKFVSALKVISLTKKIGAEDDSLESLQDAISLEAKELLHLYSLGGHQNVVGWHNHQIFNIRDSESVTALMAVMMDYLPNNLAREIRKGPIPWQRTMQILADCLRGLAHIHSKQVIHRDIKPENIFINDEGMARIGDFGVARQVSDTSQAETRVGTPLYIAPEVIKDPYGHGYDFQVDIYSLGLVGYEMLTGHLPFLEESKGNKNMMVKKRLSGAMITMPDSLPRGVRDVILGAVQYDPNQRYSSSLDFLAAVERVLASEGLDTLQPLPIVRVVPADPGAEGESWKQVPAGQTSGTHAPSHSAANGAAHVKIPPPANPGALGPGTNFASAARAAMASSANLQGAPKDPLAPPPALASVIQAADSLPPPRTAQASSQKDAEDDDFPPLPGRSARHNGGLASSSLNGTAGRTGNRSKPAGDYGQGETRSIYGVENPYETTRRRAGFNSWEVAAFMAALGGVLSVRFREDDAIASLVFLGFYVLGGLYFLLAVRRNRLLVLACFGLSLVLGNYLSIGSLESMLSAVDHAVLGMYAVVFLIAPKVNEYLGRS